MKTYRREVSEFYRLFPIGGKQSRYCSWIPPIFICNYYRDCRKPAISLYLYRRLLSDYFPQGKNIYPSTSRRLQTLVQETEGTNRSQGKSRRFERYDDIRWIGECRAESRSTTNNRRQGSHSMDKKSDAKREPEGDEKVGQEREEVEERREGRRGELSFPLSSSPPSCTLLLASGKQLSLQNKQREDRGNHESGSVRAKTPGRFEVQSIDFECRSLGPCTMAAKNSLRFESRRAELEYNALVGWIRVDQDEEELFGSQKAIAQFLIHGKGQNIRTLASLAADQETLAKTEAEIETAICEEETKPVFLPTNEASEKLLQIRHTCAHVMAMAVQKLYPDAQVTIGPWIEKGFYYDFDMKEPLAEKELKKIKKEMDKIVGRNLPLRREEVSREEAARRIKEINEPYKLEILDGIKTEPITIYHIGEEWWDLCAGPHLEKTGQIPRRAVELETVAGAYWRGDEKRPMLQRIYGTAWETEEQLKAYQLLKEEAKRRDHRRLGQDLNLFSLQEDAGGGLVFWHPKGAMVRHIIEDFWKKVHFQSGYELLYTPHVAKLDLWKTSGHYDFYRENMYDHMEVEDELYQLRPMNCPFHIQIYKDSLRSYRELPMRVAELGTVYRFERSGALHGLFRVRGFTQDDGHIFCLPDQIRGEIRNVLDLTEEILTTFGFKSYEVNLSTRPEKSVGSDEIWEKATTALREALEDKGWDYSIDEGGGAFYGPKIDIKIEDAIGRKWQCSTVQVDFNLPHRFNLVYVDTDSERKQPIMIHRAILGSIERFFGILVENYAGDFPLWLAPTQVRLIPVTDTQVPYCKDVVAKLKSLDIRAEVVYGERLSKLIRNAETQKIPVMAVVGAKEVESGTLTVRTRRGGEMGNITVGQIVEKIQAAVASRGVL